MTPPDKKLRLTRKGSVGLYIVYLLVLAVLFIIVAEIVLRNKGITPWRSYSVLPAVEPGGKFYMKHPTLGYSHLPGKFNVTLDTGYEFHVTHKPDTLRITGPDDVNPEQPKKDEIWIFGGSLTHGWSLSDEETYPWLIQERFPQYRVVNFGVSGYGTIHSLLQFEEALKTNKPEVVVLAYTQIHDERNTFSRKRRKKIAPWNKLGPVTQPYARLNDDGELDFYYADVVYKEFPMMRQLALAHLIEMKYNDLETDWLLSHTVSKLLVAKMAELAKKNGVKFIVVNVEGPDSMIKFADKLGIPNVDISVDLTIPENMNAPHDNHPSAIANRQYADNLEKFLRTELPLAVIK